MKRPIALRCPRDGTVLRGTKIGQATVDVCSQCDGTFFDSRELFTTSWDRPETGGAVKESKLRCPRCEPAFMHAQDVSHGGKHVEIDRCGKCTGVWLDKSELDTLLAIGEALQPLVAADQAKAEQELVKLGDVSFKTRWKLWPIVVAVLILGVVVGVGVSAYVGAKPPPREGGTGTRAKGEEGCPCGCDHSVSMAAELRKHPGASARSAIEEALQTISARENAGYITERMVLHRLRLLGVARELGNDHALASISRSHSPVAVDEARLPTRIAALLEGASDARTYEERQPLKRELYVLGQRAVRSLESIAASHERLEVRGLASSVLRTIEARVGRASSASTVADATLRVSAQLLVHGERTEIVNGSDKLITSSFRLWLEIENLTNGPRMLTSPSISANHGSFPISRWYEEDGDGLPWDGALGARETIAVNVIGEIADHVRPGTEVIAAIVLESLVLRMRAQAAGVIHLH